MKRIILTSAALALTVLTVSAKPNKKDENKVIDKLKYTITYRTKSVRDTTKLDSADRYNYENEDMQLEVGEKVSYFYSATYRAYIENLRKSLDGNNIQIETSSPARGNLSMDFYRGYPTGKSTYLDEVLGEKFRITEPLEQPKWDIIADSTKQILNYACQMARCKFKGRTWTAWFTTDIPLDNGPWKLYGLPGLILRAYDAKQQYIFNCVGMKQAKEGENITYNSDFDKYAASTMKEFVDYQRKAVPEDILATQGIKIEVPEEMKAEVMKALAKPQPSNPLEL